ncbi:HupE/UreJ family protein [Phenylobacterium sp. J367]|uniref:HupE/UreJ family protein n=1 Tax=Phenylobacterium sp. J367 TaxID=2898435 RepID=UPI0021513066|nr:HupE/UreJ family protein [Phenylobacterium sp. J367]MCR5878721.1 HupE/UreJ family protein [Phenylobacterium sp. J367]
MPTPVRFIMRLAPAALLLALAAGPVLAHGVADKDATFIAANPGPQVVPFLYLGAKHMVTGYDHLLFLAGVIFFLRRLRDVALYATLFSLGHSVTLLSGVLARVHVDPFLVDAVIGLSVVWKAFDNLGGFPAIMGRQPDNRIVVAGFGLVHGFGLATKLQDLRLSADGLVGNILAFNLGVEIGQLLALSVLVLVFAAWRATPAFRRTAVAANLLLMTAGFVLTGQQLAGFAFQGGR